MAEQRGNPDRASGTGTATIRVGGVAVLFVLAVVAARARAAGYLPHVAGPPGGLVLGIIRMVGVGILAAGLVLLIWGRRAQLKKLAGGKRVGKKKLDQEQRKRLVLAVLVGLITSLIYQIIMQLLGPPAPRKQGQSDQGQYVPTDGHGWIDPTRGHQPGEAGIGTYVSVVVALIALVTLAVLLLRRQEVVELDDEDEDEDEQDEETVARAMAAGRAAVRDEAILDARQAIVACFAAMERALAGVGGDVAPRLADTPEEVLRRGIAGCRLPEPPATTLLELFREARFSMHPMDGTDRARADRALAEMLESLGVGAGRGR